MNVCWDTVVTEVTEIKKDGYCIKKKSQVLFLSKWWISDENNGSQCSWIITHTAIYMKNVIFLSDNDFQWDSTTILYALYTRE